MGGSGEEPPMGAYVTLDLFDLLAMRRKKCGKVITIITPATKRRAA